MGLCLTYKVNLGLSLRKAAEVLKEIHGIHISHQQVANYCKTAAICIKPFTDNYDYGVGPCILAMCMAFRHLKELPKDFRFIADGYSTHPLATQQFYRESEGKINFDITQVIGLTNDDAVSTEHRPFKQMIERLNRTYKASYHHTNWFDNIDDANYDLALWVAYYNFLRPHKHAGYKVLNEVEMLQGADNMPSKWQLLIFLGQQTILNIQKNGTAASERNCCQ